MSRSSDPEDGLSQPAPSVEDSEIPTKDKCGVAQWTVKKKSFAVVAACIISVVMDPFFFYIGVVDKNKKCFRTETRLKNVALISRSVADILFLTDMIFHIHEARKLVAAEGGGGGKSKTRKYLTVDFFAILPIPQLLVVFFFASARRFGFSGNRASLNVLLLVQYIPRTYVPIRLLKNLRNNNMPLSLIGAFYFAAFIIASHVIGAFWYYTAFERQLNCWYQASCSSLDGECRNIYCNDDRRGYSIGTMTMINKHCSLDDGAPYAYGMFHGALKSGYMERTISGGKVAYFMWWGFKTLSNNGTDIQTSNYLWENIFAIFLAILGMVLFAYFIGHVQQCLQLATEKQEVSDKFRKKERDLREWIKRSFPEKPVEEIWPDIKEKLEKDNDAMEILYCLPKNLLNHLRMKMLKRVLELEQFEKMKRLVEMAEKASEDNAWLENNIYTYLKPVIYTQKEFIFRVGEPLDSMLYIVNGTVIIYTPTGSQSIKAFGNGRVYGRTLLMSWASTSNTSANTVDSLGNLPISTENVRCHTKVEGIVLTAEDLKTVLFKLNEYQKKEGERSWSQFGGTS